ncbi:hypothetical protein M758_4G240200 [Ceratodon purpureus]|uniref:Uncharacterized protein n=1 Tax=Ceratodon purpureus TaxID=3225 RepID=A0A8T0IED3_CERPU|nr:hypothetical protein KC19_4G236000 [Ceratodon purpureus]KAG0620747.1 hypothetical protein M758_4G240200 [Ceratodon purpureus]
MNIDISEQHVCAVESFFCSNLSTDRQLINGLHKVCLNSIQVTSHCITTSLSSQLTNHPLVTFSQPLMQNEMINTSGTRKGVLSEVME